MTRKKVLLFVAVLEDRMCQSRMCTSVCGVLLKHLKQSFSGKAEQEQTPGNDNTLQHWHLLVTSVPNCDSIFTVLHFQKIQEFNLDWYTYLSTCESPGYEEPTARQKVKIWCPIFLEVDIHICWHLAWLMSNNSSNKYTPAHLACLETVSWDLHVNRSKQHTLQSTARLSVIQTQKLFHLDCSKEWNPEMKYQSSGQQQLQKKLYKNKLAMWYLFHCSFPTKKVRRVKNEVVLQHSSYPSSGLSFVYEELLEEEVSFTEKQTKRQLDLLAF